jgi:hypothetical protein
MITDKRELDSKDFTIDFLVQRVKALEIEIKKIKNENSKG